MISSTGAQGMYQALCGIDRYFSQSDKSSGEIPVILCII